MSSGRRRALWPPLVCLTAGVLACAVAPVLGAFEVLDASAELRDGVYYLDAELTYRLGTDPLEALENGVPLVLEIHVEVIEHHPWLPDETVASLVQQFRLKYHSLTERYVVTNINSGERRSYTSRSEALQYAGAVRDLPIIDRSLLDTSQSHGVRVRVRLDVESLPAPLRLWGYVSGDWRLTSPWLEIPL